MFSCFYDNVVFVNLFSYFVIFLQAAEGYNNLCGIDYATSAIELATCIAKDINKNIVFEVRCYYHY